MQLIPSASNPFTYVGSSVERARNDTFDTSVRKTQTVLITVVGKALQGPQVFYRVRTYSTGSSYIFPPILQGPTNSTKSSYLKK